MLCSVASPLWAEVGTIEQTENGVIIRNGTTISIEVGDEVEQGDILQTPASGLIHVRMLDDTRFVVGEGTSISIDTALIGGDPTKFENLAVGVTGGVFRFLSGSSERSAYGVNTPVATMGIRGTVFDVVHDTETDLVVLDGEVEFCASETNQCIQLGASCTIGSTLDQEAQINDDQALDRFTLLLDQNPVLEDYKASTVACGDRVPQEDAALSPEPGQTQIASAGSGSGGFGGGGLGAGIGGTGGVLAAGATAAFLASGFENVDRNGVVDVPNWSLCRPRLCCIDKPDFELPPSPDGTTLQ